MASHPFNPAEKVVVVTGGGSGIGAALCTAFAQAGARAVVCADINLTGAEKVCRGQSKLIPFCFDAASDASIAKLIDWTEREVGHIDLFVANAGVLPPRDELGVIPEDASWQRVLGPNLWQHIHVAQKVVPLYLERGGGHILVTASAAGLLTQIGLASYAVSKAAAVSLAEWLLITYGSLNVGVSCLCPQGVRTEMTKGAAKENVASVDGMLEPEDVAKVTLEALAKGEFLILPHASVGEYAARKGKDRERWLKGMQRLQDRFLNAKSAVKSPASKL